MVLCPPTQLTAEAMQPAVGISLLGARALPDACLVLSEEPTRPVMVLECGAQAWVHATDVSCGHIMVCLFMSVT